MADPVTVDDIQEYLDTEFDENAETACEFLIDNAIGEIEAYLGRPVTVTTIEDESHFPGYNGEIYLLNTPVVAITALAVDGEAVDLDLFTVTSYGFENIWEALDFTTGSVDITDSLTGEPEIVVSYTAGLDFPAAIRSLVMKSVIDHMSTRSAANTLYADGSFGVRRISVEDYEIDWGVSGSAAALGSGQHGMFNDADFMRIQRYKKRAIA